MLTPPDVLRWPLWDLDAVDVERVHLERRLDDVGEILCAYALLRSRDPLPDVRAHAATMSEALFLVSEYLMDRLAEIDARSRQH